MYNLSLLQTPKHFYRTFFPLKIVTNCKKWISYYPDQSYKSYICQMLFIGMNETGTWWHIWNSTLLRAAASPDGFHNAKGMSTNNPTKQCTENYLQTAGLLPPFFCLQLPCMSLEIKSLGWNHIHISQGLTRCGTMYNGELYCLEAGYRW